MTNGRSSMFAMTLSVAALCPVAWSAGLTRLTAVQSAYLVHCGGCHGIQGVSAPAQIPTLRGQVANFLCTPEGRAYLIRLPNIAQAPLSDQMLADVMNFVVFSLGGAIAGAPSAAAYTAVEVAALRAQPLRNRLGRTRARIVADLISHCRAPESLRTYSPQ